MDFFYYISVNLITLPMKILLSLLFCAVLIGCSDESPVKPVAQSDNVCSFKVIVRTNTGVDTLIVKYGNYENQTLWFEETGNDYNISNVQSFSITPNY